MAKFDLKMQAIDLRREGKSLSEIMSELHISKSTASLWCREVSLTPEQENKLKNRMVLMGHKGRLIGAESNRMKRVAVEKRAYDEAQKIFQFAPNRDLLMVGISLYWAEGSKSKSKTGFLFVNSDPNMIRFMYDWLILFMNTPKADIYAMVSINEIHRSREDKVLNFWSGLLDLPRSQFVKTFFMKVKQKKVYMNHNEYFGVLRLGVRRSSYLKYKVLSLIDILKANVAQVVRADVS